MRPVLWAALVAIVPAHCEQVVEDVAHSTDAGRTLDGSAHESLTLEKYDEIQIGMTYRDVVKILGSRGEPARATACEGNHCRITLVWRTRYPSNANMTVDFWTSEGQGFVTGKSQAGLESGEGGSCDAGTICPANARE